MQSPVEGGERVMTAKLLTLTIKGLQSDNVGCQDGKYRSDRGQQQGRAIAHAATNWQVRSGTMFRVHKQTLCLTVFSESMEYDR